MRELEKSKHVLDMAFVLVLFFAFALAVFALSALSAGAYQRTVAGMDSNYQGRTALAYVSNKVRRCQPDMIRLEGDGDSCVLMLGEKADGEMYTTAIFAHDGQLLETEDLGGFGDIEPDADFSMPIIALESFSADMEGNLLRLWVTTTDGMVYETAIALRVAGEVAP